MASRLGAIAWLVQPLYLLAEVVTATAVTVPYSFADNTISDLGASTCTTIAYRFGDVPVCSPWHPVLNIALVVSGALMIIGALFVRHLAARGWARGLWIVAGLSSIGTGLVPLDRDLDLHVIVSLPALFAMPLALLATGLKLSRGKLAVVGLVCLAAAVTFVVRAAEPELGGLFERIALWPGYLWLGMAGVIVLRGPRRQ